MSVVLDSETEDYYYRCDACARTATLAYEDADRNALDGWKVERGTHYCPVCARRA